MEHPQLKMRQNQLQMEHPQLKMQQNQLQMEHPQLKMQQNQLQYGASAAEDAASSSTKGMPHPTFRG